MPLLGNTVSSSPLVAAVATREPSRNGIAGITVVSDGGEDRLRSRLLENRRGKILEVAGHVHSCHIVAQFACRCTEPECIDVPVVSSGKVTVVLGCAGDVTARTRVGHIDRVGRRCLPVGCHLTAMAAYIGTGEGFVVESGGTRFGVEGIQERHFAGRYP